MRRKFQCRKHISIRRRKLYGKAVLLWKRNSFLTRKLQYGKGVSFLWRKFYYGFFYYEKKVLQEKRFYHEKEVLLWNKFYYEKEIQQWKNISTEKRKIYYGKITSSWSKFNFMKERVLLWEGLFLEREFHYKKKFHCGKRVLLKEGSSIREVTRKSQWKRSSFWEGSLTEILWWDCCSFVAKRSSIMRRKFGYGTRFILRTKSYYGR